MKEDEKYLQDEKKHLEKHGIVFEIDGFYVKTMKDGYAVFRPGATHATSTETYALTPDGLSLAVASCKYMAKIMKARSLAPRR